ncbi:MEDS domain-containing protein [Halobaculum sp. EA56]|uniref:MEDS domain-containing protein n=1 Tax=Halobaculum sp. EA56 TaxID=3421648 RepID=UPI003EBBCE50
MTGEETRRFRGAEAEDTRTAADLRREFDRRDLVRHLAFFYRSPETQLTVAAAFLASGLSDGRRCLYLADVNEPTEIRSALRAAGVDAAARVEAGDLAIRDASEVYLDAGFDPDRMIRTLEETAAESVEDGYEGVFVAGENSWCFHTEASFDHVLDFEADFDAVCPDLPVTALCQYDLSRFSEESIAKALWTHKQVVYRNAVCENPFYVPPERYRATDDPATNARLMLEQTYSLSAARQQVRRREQRLSVVNRILRHNIRNDLNVVAGLLDALAETDALDAAERDHVDTAARHVDAVLDMAEKARFAQRTIGESGSERVPLAVVLDRALDRLADGGERGPADRSTLESAVAVSGDYDREVIASEYLDRAFAELFRDALARTAETDAGDPTVAVEATTASLDAVAVEVRSPAPPLSPTERRVFRRGHETDLEHANDLSLWLATWIFESGHGRIAFPEGDSYRVRVELGLAGD